MSQFNKITYTKPACEGGEEVKPKSNASYRHKANFGTPRNPRLNQRHLFGARAICILLCIANVIINIPIMLTNATNPLYALAFYSLWGTTTAFVAHVFGIVASNHEGWFKTAYIATEISYSVNIIVVLVFWLILWPGFLT